MVTPSRRIKTFRPLPGVFAGGRGAAIASSAAQWYDARDLSTTSDTQIPSRTSPTNLQLGSTAGADSNDPLIRLFDGTPRFRSSQANGQYMVCVGGATANSGRQGGDDFDIVVNQVPDSPGWDKNNAFVYHERITGSSGFSISTFNTGPVVTFGAGANPAVGGFVNYSAGTGVLPAVFKATPWWRIRILTSGNQRTIQTFTSNDGVSWTQVGNLVDAEPLENFAQAAKACEIAGSGPSTFSMEMDILQLRVEDVDANGVNPHVLFDINDIDDDGRVISGGTEWVIGNDESGNNAYQGSFLNRNLLVLDSIDDYLEMPHTPSFTRTTGEATYVAMFDITAPDQTSLRLLSAEVASLQGMVLRVSGDQFDVVCGTSGSLQETTNLPVTQGRRNVAAGVFNNGQMKAYLDGSGFTADVDYTSGTALSFNPLRVGAQAHDAGNAFSGEIYSVLYFDRALSLVELDFLSGFLKGEYT